MNIDVKADKEYIAQSRETLRNGGPEAFEVSYWIDGAKTQRTFINQ